MGQAVDAYGVHTVLGAIAVALGLSFLALEPLSRASVGVSGAWMCAGMAYILGAPLADAVDPEAPGAWPRLHTALLAGCVASSSLYASGLLGTATASRTGHRLVNALVRIGYGLAALLVVLGVLFPAQAFNDYLFSMGQPGVLERTGFWLFGGPVLVICLVYVIAWATLAGMQLDPGERFRAVCLALAVPLLALSTVAPLGLSAWAFTAAMLVMLFGYFRHFAAQGARGVFLSRFLSPQVAELVRSDGLASVMRADEVELTVVACDLRGFTAYAEGVPSQAVIDLLGEYYDAVGLAVAEVNGTIKDYAGDGILILIGAPLPHADHAADGLTLARLIHEVTAPVIDHWATVPHPLGIGVGVATGRVTVGAIGSDARMEYTAVGTPVNLAARLCSAATAGQTLVDERTASAAPSGTTCEPREAMTLKGLRGEVAVFEAAT